MENMKYLDEEVDVEMIEKKQKEIIEKMKDDLLHVAKEDISGFTLLCKLYVDSVGRKLEKNECVNLLCNEICELGLNDEMKTEVKEYAEFCKKNNQHEDFISSVDKASDQALALKKEEEDRDKNKNQLLRNSISSLAINESKSRHITFFKDLLTAINKSANANNGQVNSKDVEAIKKNFPYKSTEQGKNIKEYFNGASNEDILKFANEFTSNINISNQNSKENSPEIRKEINGDSKIDISKLMNRSNTKQNNNDIGFGRGR